MTQNQNKIQRDLVVPPTVIFSDRALQELTLIVENDFTLKGKYFRILISGKKCEGFTYSAGFTDMEGEDFLIDITNENSDLQVIIDPFAAFYLNNTEVDFIQNFEEGNEGFVITNKNQDNFKGKFWRADESKIPPLKDA